MTDQPAAHLSHTTNSTYDSRECPFCASTFSRVDAARRHALRCPRRGGRPLHLKQRGRRAQACDECSRLKVHCDRRLPNPCQRCVLRKLDCTFDRARASTNTRPQLVVAELQDSEPHDRKREALTFLLNSTDDKQDFFTERTIGDEPDRPLLGPTCLTTPKTHSPMDGLLDCFDPSQLSELDMDSLFMPLELNSFFATGNVSPLDSQAFLQPCDALLSARLETLESELATHTSKGHLQTSFNRNDYREFFSMSNVESFAVAFCRKRHYQYPIIHWPTFALEEASLPLLLAVALTGAAYSLSEEHGTKYIAEARKFYQLADSYIFDQLDATVGGQPSGCSIADPLQICQAALLMYGLEVFMPSNSAMRDVAINRRLPSLISTLRRLDFITCRNHASEDWQLFLQKEQIVRLVAWTYCVDGLATLVFNKLPGFSLLEASGSLPCDPNLWEADSVMSYESLRPTYKSTDHSLVELMSGLLDKKQCALRKFENTPTFHLHVVLFAFQHHIYNLQVTMTLGEQSTKLLHSLQTWRQRWQKALSELSDGDRQLLGVAKHVCDVEYLTRRIVEVAVSPDCASSPYLRRIPSTSTKLIHDFIRDHVSEQE